MSTSGRLDACCVRLLLLLISVVAAWTSAHAEPDAVVSKEYQIKAAFLYNIPKFVEWPATSFATATEPLVIAVFGDSPFGDQLQNLVTDRRINGRSIVVKHVVSVDDIEGAHLLFFSSRDDKQFAAIKAVIRDRPVLTVGESSRFADAGGTVNFVLIGDKVRFEINMDSAQRAGLKISAQLQKLASTIRKTP